MTQLTPENKDIPSIEVLAVQYRTITKQQLQEAFAYLKEHENNKIKLTDVFIQKKMATKHQINLLELIRDFLIVKKKSEQFGKIAIEKGFATPDEVKKALAVQKEEFRQAKLKRLLGEILVDAGVISRGQQEMISREQKRLEDMTVKVLESDTPVSKTNKTLRFKDYEKEFLKIQALDRAFASSVVEKGYASANDVEDAVKAQRSEFETMGSISLLGDIMVSRKTLTEQQKILILAQQERLDKKDLLDALPLEIIISDDAMKVWVRIDWKTEHTPQLKLIQRELRKEGIKNGIFRDSVIQCHLDRKDIFFEVAGGTYAETGKPVYLFDTEDWAKASIKKNRPLAAVENSEKPPVILNVFGNPISKTLGLKYNHPSPRPGKGVALSEDRKRLIAGKSGIPGLSKSGRVYIFPVVHILEDADFRFGPIEKFASVQVAGTLTGAYPVKVGRVKAREIRGCDLECIEDVHVHMGINGSWIRTQGNVYARYIHNSRIEAFGDVIVEHEIIDSDIYISGKCEAVKSRIIASGISARKGVIAAGIGSDVTEPCTISVGREEHIILQSLKINAQIKETEKEINKLKENQNALFEKSETIFKKLVELKGIHDRAEKMAVASRSALKKMNRLTQKEDLKKNVRLLKALKKKMDSSIKMMKKLNARKKMLDEKQVRLKERIKRLKPRVERKIMEFEMDRAAFLRWGDKEPGVPEIKVQGPVAGSTIIKGVYSTLTLEKSYRNIKLTEQKKKNHPDSWEIKMIPGGT